MTFSPAALQKAKRRCVLYYICFLLCWLPAVALFATFYFGKMPLRFLLTYLAALLYIKNCSAWLSQKILISVLEKDLEADTFLAIFHKTKTGISLELKSLYHAGYYPTVIRKAEAKLEALRTQKKPNLFDKYCCLVILCQVSFDRGDDEGFRRAFARYQASEAEELPQDRAKLRSVFPITTFFRLYACGDVDGAIRYACEPVDLPLAQCVRTFYVARLALIRGDREEARVRLEHLASSCPRLNFGQLAARLLQDMEREDGGTPAPFCPDTFPDVSPEQEAANLAHKRRRALIDKILIALLCVCVVLGVFETLL